jgi:metallo-beta-lactamase class B
MKVDVFLAGHPEFFAMSAKRARMGEGGPNPFVDSAEFPAFMERSEADFRKQLAAQKTAHSNKRRTAP